MAIVYTENILYKIFTNYNLVIDIYIDNHLTKIASEMPVPHSLGNTWCSGKGEIIDWFCCVSNLQPSDYTQI